LPLVIARVANRESIHFTATSSIAATFDWTSTVGLGGQLNTEPKSNFLNLDIGASAPENSTFSILPVAGKDFTKRVATPFQDSAFEFLVFQGGRVDEVMRLMAGGVEVQSPCGAFARFIENDPRRPEEYEEFRLRRQCSVTDSRQWASVGRQARTISPSLLAT